MQSADVAGIVAGASVKACLDVMSKVEAATPLVRRMSSYAGHGGFHGSLLRGPGPVATPLAVGQEMPMRKLRRLLSASDLGSVGVISTEVLEQMWSSRFQGEAACHSKPVHALLIIDVQNDFIDGTLALKNCPAGQDGAAVVPVINKLRSSVPFDAVAISLDWHPHEHCSFHEVVTAGQSPAPLHPSQAWAPLEPSCARNPCHCACGQDPLVLPTLGLFSKAMLSAPNGSKMEQTLWPRHCVQDTWGSACHADLVVLSSDIQVVKGTDPRVDSYSAFYDNAKLRETTMLAELSARGVTHVYLCGLALDVCVTFSALHAAELGFVVHVIEDASAGVSLDGIASMKAVMEEAGIRVVQSADVAGIVANASMEACVLAATKVMALRPLVREVSSASSEGHGSHRR